MDKISYVLESFKNIQDLIKFIDQKSGAVLVVSGLAFTGYIEFLKDLILVSPKSATFFGILSFLFSLATLISLTIVIYISIFRVLKPRKAKHYKADEASMFYFEHLLKLGKEQVFAHYKLINENDMLKNLIDQQHEVSIILSQKDTDLKVNLWRSEQLINFAV
jgi:hypothetical protein